MTKMTDKKGKSSKVQKASAHSKAVKKALKQSAKRKTERDSGKGKAAGSSKGSKKKSGKGSSDKPELFFSASLFATRECIFNIELVNYIEQRGYPVILSQRDGFEFDARC